MPNRYSRRWTALGILRSARAAISHGSAVRHGTAGCAEVPLAKVFLPVVPFMLVSFVVLMLITYVPWLVLIIPNLLMP